MMAWEVVPANMLRNLTNATALRYLRQERIIPRFFMTGDAHHNNFSWVTSCQTVQDHFVQLMNDRMLITKEEDWWLGWIEEILGANAQERTRDLFK